MMYCRDRTQCIFIFKDIFFSRRYLQDALRLQAHKSCFCFLFCVMRRLIRLIESNAKCRHLKLIIDLKRDFAEGVYLSEAPSPPRFLFGDLKVLNLVRYRVLNSSRIWSPTRLNIPQPLPATHFLYILYFREGGKGRGGEQKRGLKGNSSKSWVENSSMTDWISSL